MEMLKVFTQGIFGSVAGLLFTGRRFDAIRTDV